MTPPRLVLYDGVCGLCARSVRLLVRIDRERQLRYAPLQGSTAAQLRADGVPVPEELVGVVYVHDGQLWLASSAVAELCRALPLPWRAGAALRFVPRPVRDGVYNFIAKRRYRWFGRFDVCRLPAPDEEALFLD